MMPEQAKTPDTQAILAHLTHITRRWHEIGQDARLEIVHLSAEDRAQVKQVSHYKATPEDLQRAATDCAAMNRHKINTYAVVNPIDASNMPKVQKRAKAENILGSFFHWADADSAEAANNIRNFVGPKCNFYVLTGTTPSPRPHVYWELEDFTRNEESWTKTQRAIAATLGTDPAVVDFPRIMRVAGTINWPKPQKAAKGYIAELTALHVYDQSERPLISSDRMQRAFHGATQAPSGGFAIDAGGMATLDREQARIQALSGMDWHNAVIRLVASYVARGFTDEEIHRQTDPLTLEGYTVDDTRREVQTAIDGARSKGWTPTPEPQPSPDAVETTPDGIITGLRIQTSAEFLSDLTPAEYVVDGVIAKRRCLSLTGYAGHGKTTLALHMAIQVATGRDFAGMECEQGSALILAGENPDNVKWQYAAACAASGVGDDLPIHFLPGHFQLSAYLDDLMSKAASIPNLRLVVIDSLQAFFEGENDNGNVEMMDAARRFRSLCDIPSGPAVLVIAHPAGKRPDRDNIVPRGGSAFGNEMDGNLTVWSEPDGTQVMHHSEKFRGAPFDPLNFIMEDREFDHLKDHKGRNLRLKVSRMQMVIEQANAAQKSARRDRDAMALIDSRADITVRELAEALRISKSTADRVMQSLKDEKLIHRRARKWVLTDEGKEFLNDE